MADLKGRWRCEACGSHKILWQADIDWNYDLQLWVARDNFHDNPWCEHCVCETDTSFVLDQDQDQFLRNINPLGKGEDDGSERNTG
jgi:hypothetical protein